MEERLRKEFNLITSRESGGHRERSEQPCVSRLDVTGNSRERLWMSFRLQGFKKGDIDWTHH